MTHVYYALFDPEQQRYADEHCVGRAYACDARRFCSPEKAAETRERWWKWKRFTAIHRIEVQSTDIAAKD